MEKTDLQLFLGERITISKLPKEAKLQLLNFVQKEANTHQLMALILDGKIIKIEDDATKQIIEARFNTVSEIAPLAIAGAAAAAIVAKKLNYIRKRFMACKESCMGKTGTDKAACMTQCKTSYKSKMKAAKIAGKKAGKTSIKDAKKE